MILVSCKLVCVCSLVSTIPLHAARRAMAAASRCPYGQRAHFPAFKHTVQSCSLAKEAVAGPAHSVRNEFRWQASLPHPSQRITENRSRSMAQWVSSHVRPERRHRPPDGTGLRQRALHKVRKSLAGRYYQLLSGHAAIGTFLHDRMTGPQRLESDKYWWCSRGKRRTRHHLFTEYQEWAPQIRRLWKRIGRDCQWQHPRAPSRRLDGGGRQPIRTDVQKPKTEK